MVETLKLISSVLNLVEVAGEPTDVSIAALEAAIAVLKKQPASQILRALEDRDLEKREPVPIDRRR